MPSVQNQQIKQVYVDLLKKNPNVLFTRFSGLTVEQITKVRGELRKEGVEYRVIRNNIFELALKDANSNVQVPEGALVGPIAVVFANDQAPKAAKGIDNLAKEFDKLQIFSAIIENEFYDEKNAKKVSSLPTREEVLSTLAATLNGPATKTAGLLNNIMASLARAIKAVGEKNG